MIITEINNGHLDPE